MSNFTFSYLKRMLLAAINEGYVISSFEKYKEYNKNTIILRHDVDYTLNGVMQIALIEHDLGISSTFMFRVHAHEYNLFTPHVFRMVSDLRKLGHEIGLHLEAMTVGRALGLDPVALAAKEKALLEMMFGGEIASTSEHRDISHVVHETPYFHEICDPASLGFRHYGMGERYFRKMKYLSDSNGVWREGDLLEHLGKHDRFQVLIHPDWWFEEDLLLKGPYFHGLGN
jgi:hypothetical protein